MKSMTKIIGLMLVSTTMLMFGCSSAPDEPVVTYEQQAGGSNALTFGAQTAHVLHDANRRCPNMPKKPENHFVTVKSNRTIASSDICTNCGKSWQDHRKQK
jgi:hypothetical protein